jgi:magnesium transporter
MAKRRKNIPVMRPDSHKTPPGTLKAPVDASPSRLSVMSYSLENLVEERDISFERMGQLSGTGAVTWVDLEGLADAELLENLGKQFGLHRLGLEDSLNIPQRPKLDDYGDHQYVVARMPVSHENLETEQVSIFLGKDFLVTVQEQPGDCFDGVRTRLREGRARIRGGGADYLAYALVDAIVDAYFPLLDSLANRVDRLELAILEQPAEEQVTELHEIKRSLITLRRYLGPLRDLTAALVRDDSPILGEQARVYMADCYDHARHAYDLVESYRDIAIGLMDLYLSMMSQRMNEVMKVLTIIATVFIPLSFIAGVYGMNFDPQASPWNMPETGWAFGYPFALGLMLIVGGGMVAYFVRKGWFR